MQERTNKRILKKWTKFVVSNDHINNFYTSHLSLVRLTPDILFNISRTDRKTYVGLPIWIGVLVVQLAEE